jgi:hypothetical protein
MPLFSLAKKPDPVDEQVQAAYKKVLGENPNMQPVTVSPRSGLFGWLTPSMSDATTNPLTGNVTYNPTLMADKTQAQKEQAIAHELSHARDVQNRSLGERLMSLNPFRAVGQTPAGFSRDDPHNNNYMWDPEEMKAFQAERDRANLLRLPNQPDPVTGAQDIHLMRPSIFRARR